MDAYEAEHIYYVLKSDEAARLPVALRKALAHSRRKRRSRSGAAAAISASGSTRCCILERSLHKMLVHTTDGDLETTQSPPGPA